MSDVRMVKLGDIGQVISGATPKTSVPEYWGGDIYWATPKDLSRLESAYINSTERTITESGKASCATSILPENSVLLSSRAPIGHVAINTTPMATNQGFKSIIPTNDVIPKYLYHWLSANKYYIRSMGNGATFKEISKKVVESVVLPLPPLEEQKRIVAILDKVQSIQEARKSQLTNLDNPKHSLLQKTINSSTIQETPLGKAISLKSGLFLPAKNQDGGKFPVYGGNGVNGSHSQYMIEEPTIIIGRVGAYCGAVHITHPKSWVTDNALIATIQTEEISQTYLAYALHSINLNQYANRSGQPSISAKRIKDIPIPIIPLTKQEKFTKNINNIDRQISLTGRSLKETNELFLSLQSTLFNN